MTAKATEDPEYAADEDLAMSPAAAARSALLDWEHARCDVESAANLALVYAAPIAGAMAGTYPQGANTALVQDALDIAEKLIAESAKRQEAALAAFDAANPRPEAAEGAADD